ncbi:hypothetical protein [Allomesorhizobium camelthorni]|uniref:Uncharacterized protein n=1 Tax=Allomesorhizobium camelthorni TaxID=475069 RepID=A0A6G4WMR7_9HYPH|nr:hypothetical protein [Mesorhizobium camelthorni]NGO56115.1 hypothetical protein [Mesorhizobium camelthorni]
MSETEPLSQRWQNYRPSKTLWFWSLAGISVLTMILGFTVGGWTTGGGAAVMAELAAREARSTLAASLCVQNFVSTEGAAEQLAALKEASTWERDTFIEDGGWAMLAGMEDTIPGAAELCAKELVAMESLPEQNIEAVSTDG